MKHIDRIPTATLARLTELFRSIEAVTPNERIDVEQEMHDAGDFAVILRAVRPIEIEQGRPGPFLDVPM